MKKISIAIALLMIAAPVSGAFADGSLTITAPMVTWEQQQANIAAWNAGNTAPLLGISNQSAGGRSAPGCSPNTDCASPGNCDGSAGCKPAASQSQACGTAACNTPGCTTSACNTPACRPASSTPFIPPAVKNIVVDANYSAGPLTAQEQKMVQSVNQDRVTNGASPLPVDMELTGLARMKSADMIANNYFAHESPSLGKAAQMLKDHGYAFTSVGENIARSGSAEKAHAALMSSSGHRQNILGRQWTRMGIGVVNDASGFPYVTQLFVR